MLLAIGPITVFSAVHIYIERGGSCSRLPLRRPLLPLTLPPPLPPAKPRSLHGAPALLLRRRHVARRAWRSSESAASRQRTTRRQRRGVSRAPGQPSRARRGNQGDQDEESKPPGALAPAPAPDDSCAKDGARERQRGFAVGLMATTHALQVEYV